MQTSEPHVLKATNRLFAALPQADWDRWAPHLELVTLEVGQVIFEQGRPLSHVVFPITSIVSLQCNLEDGSASEFALTGNEGMVGAPASE